MSADRCPVCEQPKGDYHETPEREKDACCWRTPVNCERFTLTDRERKWRAERDAWKADVERLTREVRNADDAHQRGVADGLARGMDTREELRHHRDNLARDVTRLHEEAALHTEREGMIGGERDAAKREAARADAEFLEMQRQADVLDGMVQSRNATILALRASLARAEERCGALEAALRPFVKAFRQRAERGSAERRAWHEKMPGGWPIELLVCVGAGRDARAALLALPAAPAQDEGPKCRFCDALATHISTMDRHPPTRCEEHQHAGVPHRGAPAQDAPGAGETGVQFRRDSDETSCPRVVPGTENEYAADGGLACMRRAGHEGTCIAPLNEAATADGVCWDCRAPLAGPHRSDCEAEKFAPAAAAPPPRGDAVTEEKKNAPDLTNRTEDRDAGCTASQTPVAPEAAETGALYQDVRHARVRAVRWRGPGHDVAGVYAGCACVDVPDDAPDNVACTRCRAFFVGTSDGGVRVKPGDWVLTDTLVGERWTMEAAAFADRWVPFTDAPEDKRRGVIPDGPIRVNEHRDIVCDPPGPAPRDDAEET